MWQTLRRKGRALSRRTESPLASYPRKHPQESALRFAAAPSREPRGDVFLNDANNRSIYQFRSARAAIARNRLDILNITIGDSETRRLSPIDITHVFGSYKLLKPTFVAELPLPCNRVAAKPRLVAPGLQRVTP
jgi:hypothetical protein